MPEFLVLRLREMPAGIPRALSPRVQPLTKWLLRALRRTQAPAFP
jgi:hypothetical protein